jgi:hypothetical protein
MLSSEMLSQIRESMPEIAEVEHLSQICERWLEIALCFQSQKAYAMWLMSRIEAVLFVALVAIMVALAVFSR